MPHPILNKPGIGTSGGGSILLQEFANWFDVDRHAAASGFDATNNATINELNFVKNQISATVTRRRRLP
jgi:glycerate-2-kinase